MILHRHRELCRDETEVKRRGVSNENTALDLSLHWQHRGMCREPKAR